MKGNYRIIAMAVLSLIGCGRPESNTSQSTDPKSLSAISSTISRQAQENRAIVGRAIKTIQEVKQVPMPTQLPAVVPVADQVYLFAMDKRLSQDLRMRLLRIYNILFSLELAVQSERQQLVEIQDPNNKLKTNMPKVVSREPEKKPKKHWWEYRSEIPCAPYSYESTFGPGFTFETRLKSTQYWGNLMGTSDCIYALVGDLLGGNH